jgi:hypothetical protein
MSKHNKANKNNYTQAGRLTPDEMAREIGMREDRLKARVDRPQKNAEQEPNRPRSAPEE